VSTAPFVSLVDRIPPSNLEAEMALLGSVLVDKEMMAAVCEIVRPSDFYASLHETIYLALFALYESGKPLDKVALAEELRSRGMLEKIGGLAYLSSLMETVPTAASAEYYAKIVREKASLRGLIHAGTRITQLGYESEDDVPAALDESEQIVYEVGNRDSRGAFSVVSSLLLDTFHELEKRHAQRGDRTGITSGFADIDDYTAGFQKGNLIILAARPAMGKTSLALNMALFAARDEASSVAVFSLEMTKQELVERLISSDAGIDATKLRRGAIEGKDWERIGNSIGRLNELPLFLDDSGSVTVTEIRSRLRRLKSTHGLGIAFIDYLQLVRPAALGRNVNRNEELSEICRTLKATAKDLEIPIVALAQLNRAVETRQDKRPMLSDLRDCLAGSTLVANADTGERVPMSDIVAGGLRFNVWAMDDRLRLVRRPITDAWAVGSQAVFDVTTQSGRSIRCTAGHRFRTVAGWSELRDLALGEPIAAPRRLLCHSEGANEVERRRGTSHDRARASLLAHSRSHSIAAVVAHPSTTLGVTALLEYSDVVWDPVVSIEPAGTELVYDLTVGELHNFVVDDLLTHNSGAIEQEADIVTFLYRDAYYNKETSPEPDLTELIFAKHRNGRVGTVKLRFRPEHTLFQPYGDDSHFPAP
jgi:replicative DNA helicase